MAEVSCVIVPNSTNPVGDRRYLEMYVITTGTKDYPGKYVVRRQVCKPGRVEIDRDPIGVRESLPEARQLVPGGKVRMQPDGSDDPVIVETWI